LLLLLTLSYIMAQAATQVMGLLVVPVQASLHTSNTQMGFLQGFAFIFIYVVAGIPIARLIDRGNRIHIMAACVLLFSLATMASGLAQSFVELALLRAGTAISEAGLTPAAYSIFSETGSAKRTARANATFMLSPFLGAGVALGGGGIIARVLPHWALGASIGFDEPWRVVLFFIGLPGIFLAAALLIFAKDPAQGGPHANRPQSDLKLIAVLRLIFVEQRFFRAYHAALACFITFLFGYLAWFPTFLIGRFHISFGAAGSDAGFTYMAGGVAGTLYTIAIAGRRERKGGLNATLTWFAIAMLLVVPLSLAIPLMPDIRLTILGYGIASFLAASFLCIMVLPLQLALPLGVQGRAVAIFTFLVTAIGGTLGPLIIGLLSDHAHLAIGTALMLNGVVMSSLAACFMFVARAGAARAEVLV
jgi:MFS family permease